MSKSETCLPAGKVLNKSEIQIFNAQNVLFEILYFGHLKLFRTCLPAGRFRA
jgi:hypothetical protein